MKGLYILVSILLIQFGMRAQNHPYCINGRFAENDFYSPIAIESDLDVVYGMNTNVSGNIDTLHMDVYYPNKLIDGLPKRPLVMMVHGGAWYSGSKLDMSNYCQQLARRGYIAATIDYRIGWDHGSTACSGNIAELDSAMYRSIQDLNAALRYITYHAGDFDLDTNAIFLAGQSEGGWMALHTAFMQQNEANILFPGFATNLGGIANSTNSLTNSFSLKGIFNWCGSMSDTSIIQASENIPVLSIHGLQDSIMPVDTGTYFHCLSGTSVYPFFYGPKAIEKRLQHLGICSETNFDAAGYHCNFPSLEPIVYIPSKFTCFFKNILCGNCTTQTKTGYNSSSCMDAAPLSTTDFTELKLPYVSYLASSKTISVYADISENSNFSFQLLNLNGQLIYKSNELIFNQGINQYYFHVPTNLSRGLYLVSYQFNREVRTVKINIED